MLEFTSVPGKHNQRDAKILRNASGYVKENSTNHQFNKRNYFSVLRNACGILEPHSV